MMPTDPNAITPKKPAVPTGPTLDPMTPAPQLAAAPSPAPPTAPATAPQPGALPLAPSTPDMSLPDNQRGAVPTSMLAQPGASNDEMWAKYNALNPGAAGRTDPAGTTHTLGGGWDQMQRPGGAVTAGPVTGLTQAQFAAANPDPSQAVHDASNAWYAANGVANPDLPSASLTPSAATDRTPSTPASLPLAAQTAASPAGLPLAGPSAGGVGNTPTDPGNDLTSQTIAPGPGLDRFGLAQAQLDNLRQQSEPRYRAEQRALTQNAAAGGQLHSGMFRTSLGDAERQHELDNQNGELGFLGQALNGSVDDQYRNIGIAQQQQGFQAGQQQTAFSQAVIQSQVEEALRNGDFQRAQALLAAGERGNPSDTALTLAQSYGQQAGQAGAAAGQLVSGAVGANAAQQRNATLDPQPSLPPNVLTPEVLAKIYGALPQAQDPVNPLPLAGVYGDG